MSKRSINQSMTFLFSLIFFIQVLPTSFSNPVLRYEMSNFRVQEDNSLDIKFDFEHTFCVHVLSL